MAWSRETFLLCITGGKGTRAGLCRFGGRKKGVSAFGFNFLQEVLTAEKDGNCRRAGRGREGLRSGSSAQSGELNNVSAWPGGKYRMRIHGI